jgi:hypothetical protein
LHDFDGSVRPSLAVKLAICGGHVAPFSRLLGDEHDATQGSSAHRRRLIHRSAWKKNSPKSGYRIPHNPIPIGPETADLPTPKQ